MARFRLDVAYDGAGFSGWQVQPGQRTVQGELARMVESLGEPTMPTGAGRTDAGVHALGNAAHVDLNRSWEDQELKRALVSLSPPDIEVTQVTRVGEDFHARYDAVRRVYAYALSEERDLFHRAWRWEGGSLPDRQWVERFCEPLQGPIDGEGISRKSEETKSTLCDIKGVSWLECERGALFLIAANRFLYGMVRTLVGTLASGSRKGYPPSFLGDVLRAKDRSQALEAAPAHGLFLLQVQYPGDPSHERERLKTLRELSGLGDVKSVTA